MAQIKISQLTTGIPQGTDETPATDPTDTTQAASGTTKKYIRSDELNYYLHAQGLTTYSAVRVATTGALTVTYNNGSSGVGATLTNAGAQAAIAIDGVTLALNDRVLVKNQAAQLQNGIYTVTNLGSASTNWVLTRATDFDTASEIIQYGVVLTNQGTTNAGILFQETAAGPFTIGVSSITFAAYTAQSFGGYTWTEVTGTSQQMAVNTGYIANNVALVTLTLPATASVGQSVIIQGKGTGLFTIAQNAGQTIHFGTSDTTTGVGGSLTATNRYDSLEILCITANTDWAVLAGAQGSLTVV